MTLEALVRRWRLLLAVSFVAGAVAFAVASLLRPSFTATTRIVMPQQPGSTASLLTALSGLAGGGGGALSSLRSPVDQWVSLLRSRTIADAMIGRFGLKARYEVQMMFEARNELAGNSRISGGKDNIITVEVDDHDPQVAADIANAYVDELQRLSKNLAVTEAAQRRLFFERQLAQSRDTLVKAEIALKQSGVGPNVLKVNPEAVVRELVQIKAQVAAADIKVAMLRTAVADGSPELQQALAQLSTLRGMLARAEASDGAAPHGTGAEYVERYRNFKYQETLFELLARQFELAKADEAREGAVIQVVDTAVPPERKSKPRRAVIALSAFLLAFVAAALIVLIQGMRRRGGLCEQIGPRENFEGV